MSVDWSDLLVPLPEVPVLSIWPTAFPADLANRWQAGTGRQAGRPGTGLVPGDTDSLLHGAMQCNSAGSRPRPHCSQDRPAVRGITSRCATLGLHITYNLTMIPLVRCQFGSKLVFKKITLYELSYLCIMYKIDAFRTNSGRHSGPAFSWLNVKFSSPQSWHG